VLGWEPEVELDEGLKRLLASGVPGSAPGSVSV
jgi:nucleoside-diphosphate-sugar epimerase